MRRRPLLVAMIGVIAMTIVPLMPGQALAQTARAATRSPEIRQVQQALKAKGQDPGPIDGALGPRTRAALKAYQKAEKLPETGEVEAETLARLGLPSGKLRPSPARVRDVQQALTDLGLDPGPIDGQMGPRTRAALQKYAAPPAPSPASAIVERFTAEFGRPQSP